MIQLYDVVVYVMRWFVNVQQLSNYLQLNISSYLALGLLYHIYRQNQVLFLFFYCVLYMQIDKIRALCYNSIVNFYFRGG